MIGILLQVLVQREKALIENIRASLEAMWVDCPAIVQLQKTPTFQQQQQGGVKRGILQAFSNPASSNPGLQEGKSANPEKRQRTLENFLSGKTNVQDEENVNEDWKDISDHLIRANSHEDGKSVEEKRLSVEKENLEHTETSEVVTEGLKITFESSATSGEKNTKLELFDTPPMSQGLVAEEAKELITPLGLGGVATCTEGLKISFEPVPSRSALAFPDSTSNGLKQHSSEEQENRSEDRIAANAGTHYDPNREANPDIKPIACAPNRIQITSKSEDVKFSIESLKEDLEKISKDEEEKKQIRSLKFKAKIEPGENRSAEEELNKQIQKSDFAKMEIFGQFNLGFLIVGLGKDLFIVDQHATDEKYNFETLQRTTHIKPQKMVVAQGLELTAGDEATLIDHLEVFQKNGFQFEVDGEAVAGRRVKLVAVPTSKNWVFGKEDIDELIFMLSDAGGDLEGVSLRPSRVC